MKSVDLLLIGHLANDENVVKGQCHRTVGGAVFFGAFAFAAGESTGLVATKLAPDDEPLLEELLKAGLPVHWTPSSATVGIRNIYTTEDQDRRECVLLNAGEPFGLDDLPDDVSPRVIHVGGLIAGQVPDALLPVLARRARLGLDAQGVLRDVEEGDRLHLRPWDNVARHLPRVTFFKADAAEAEILTGEQDLDRAAMALAAMGPSEVVLTHAAEIRVVADGRLHRAPFNPSSLEGRTGRGDTCMCAYLSARLENRSPRWAMRYAAALTSIKMEQPGPFRGTRQQVLARMESA